MPTQTTTLRTAVATVAISALIVGFTSLTGCQKTAPTPPPDAQSANAQPQHGSPQPQKQGAAKKQKSGGRRKPVPLVPLPAPPVRMATAKKQSIACAECHLEIGDAFKKDVHTDGDFSCVVCHGESKDHLSQKVEGARPDHTWRRWIADKWEWRSENATLEIAQLCGSCHVGEAARAQGAPHIDWRKFSQNKHTRGMNRGKTSAPTCTDCHITHSVSDEPWTDEQIIELCASCHGDQLAGFKSGKHGKGKVGKATPEHKANCAKCHRPH